MIDCVNLSASHNSSVKIAARCGKWSTLDFTLDFDVLKPVPQATPGRLCDRPKITYQHFLQQSYSPKIQHKLMLMSKYFAVSYYGTCKVGEVGPAAEVVKISHDAQCDTGTRRGGNDVITRDVRVVLSQHVTCKEVMCDVMMQNV